MKKQMSLGEIIATLKRKEPDAQVYLDFVHFRPAGIHSYRGYYNQLAIAYGHDDITVAELLKLCEDADGETFTGYKGGEYEMGFDTPVWVANHDEAGSTAIVDIEDRDWRIMLITASVEQGAEGENNLSRCGWSVDKPRFWFKRSFETSLKNGWTIVYDGAPLYG